MSLWENYATPIRTIKIWTIWTIALVLTRFVFAILWNNIVTHLGLVTLPDWEIVTPVIAGFLLTAAQLHDS